MNGLLLLGLVRADDANVRTDPPHLRLGPVEGLVALAMELDLLPEDRSGEGWTIEAALAQNRVLSAYAIGGDVLPVALGSGFSGPAAVCRHLERESAAIAIRMRRIAGKSEYILRLLCIDGGASAPVEAASGGAAFLRRRSASRALRRGLGTDREMFARDLAADLCAAAASVVRRPGRADGPLLDLSLLVDRTRTGALIEAGRARADAASALSLAIRMIGPCAPHSFIGKEETCDA